MTWNIFKRIAELESQVASLQVRMLVAESNMRSISNNTPRSLSEAEVKKRLKAAAYARSYYKAKKEAEAKTAAAKNQSNGYMVG